MQASEIEVSAVSKALATMIGEYVWASRVGKDAILRLDFGAPRLHVDEPSPRAAAFAGAARTALGRRVVLPVGRWHLFVGSGLWRVAVPGIACDRRDAEHDHSAMAKQVTKCLSLLDGQKLTAAEVVATGAWQFAFDLGGELSIGLDPTADPREALWTLFRDDGTSLSSMPDGTFEIERTAETA